MSLAVADLKLEDLTVQERLELIEAIWNSLPQSLAPEEIQAWHIELLEERLAEAEKNPGVGIPWREALAKLKSPS